MMRKKQATICLLIILSLNIRIFGQEMYQDPKNQFPFSPETSSIKRFQEIPVSNYTGVPDISIPLYTVKSKNLEIPITLNYHSGGILVSDIPSSVGLGWSLQTVSPITRKINGYIDEKGIMLHDNNITDFINQNLANKQLRLNSLTNPTNSSVADLSPDEFNISIPDFSGNFLFNSETDKMVTFPFSNLKINYNIVNTPENRGIGRINIVDTKGMQYTFGDDGTETSGFDQSNYFNGPTAWKIKKIKNVENNEVNFKYIKNDITRWESLNRSTHTAYKKQYYEGCNETGAYVDYFSAWEASYPSSPADQGQVSSPQFIGTESLLQEIQFPEGLVQFIYSQRLDFTNQKKLDKILIKDLSGNIISERRFNYDYFTTTGVNNSNFPGPEDRSKKLKLLSIDECDQNNQCITTKFQYYENTVMPERQSYAFDYWGYFNNKGINGFVKAPIQDLNYSTGNPYYRLSSDKYHQQYIADRNVNINYAKAYSLRLIKYPEGGVNEFIYESNMASSFIKEPDTNHYYFDAGAYPDMTKKNESFIVSGYVEGSNIYTGYPAHNYSDNNSKTYIKEIDISKYEKKFEMKLNYYSTFKASTFSNNLLPEALHATLSIYYYDDNNAKIYWIQGSEMPSEGYTSYFHKFNNQNVPSKKIYIEIKHTYWGGLGSGNISSSSIPYSSNFNIEWDERKPNTENTNFYGGGLRIKEIRSYDNNGAYKSSLKYNYLKEDGKTSSGVMFNVPIYVSNTRIGYNEPTNCQYGMGTAATAIAHDGTEISVNPVISGMNTKGKSVGYSRVEVRKVDFNNNTNGKEIFEYYIEPPYPTGDNLLSNNETTTAKYEFLENRDWRNGNLSKHSVFDENGSIIKKTEKEYYLNGPPNISSTIILQNQVKTLLYRLIPPVDYVFGDFFRYPIQLPSIGSGRASGFYSDLIGIENVSGRQLPIYTFHADAFLLKEDKTTEYFNGKEVITKTQYEYNDLAFPLLNTDKITTFPDNSVLKTKYQYSSVNQFLADQNFISIPLESTVSKIIGGISKVLSKTEVIYPSNSSQALQTNGLILPLSVKSYDLSNNSANAEVLFDKYDGKGNLLQYRTKENIPVSIIWGYNQTRPIIKIEGAQYNDVENNSLILAARDFSNNNNNTQLLQVFNNIGNNSSLINYQITTYTYNPLVGVTSITPPSGHKEFYEYDSFNRLKAVKDINSKILKEYTYNYTPSTPISINTYYNVGMSQSFTKNDCPSNFLGGSFVFSVPADKYSSNISQTDANQKALAEINNNGQNMANIYASCIPAADVSCPFTPTNNYNISHYNSNFVYKPAINSVNAQYVFALPYFTTSLDWSQGVYLGSIASNCAPSANRTVVINNGSNVWNMIIDTSGQLTLKLISGSINYSSTPISFNFQYQK